MDAPEELRQAVMDAIVFATIFDPGLDSAVAIDFGLCADAVLAVPAIADARRDAALFAKVLEAWRSCDGDQSDLEMALSQIMPPLYPEAGKPDA